MGRHCLCFIDKMVVEEGDVLEEGENGQVMP